MPTTDASPIDATLLIAILGLLTSLATLFIAYMSPAKVKCSFGPTITLFYDIEKKSYDPEKARYVPSGKRNGLPLYLFVPMTFVNHGTKTGSVYRAAIALYSKAHPDQVFFMQWRAFCSNNRETGIWGEDELAHEVSTKGNSSLVKWVSFYWGLQPAIDITEGQYIIDFYYWDKVDSIPKQERHELLIDKVSLSDINKNRKGNREMVELSLDNKLKPNMFVKPNQLGKMLDDLSKGFVIKTNQIAFGSALLGGFSYASFYIVSSLITISSRYPWYMIPSVVAMLIVISLLSLGGMVAGGITLSRFWASRKIINNIKQRWVMTALQLLAPCAGVLFSLASIYFAIKFILI